MKRYLLILGCSLAITLTFVVVSQKEELTYSKGAPHDAYPTMKQGGSPSRHHEDSLISIGWINGTAQVILFTVIIALGLKDDKASRSHWGKVITISGLLYVLVYAALMFSYSGGDLKSRFPLGLTQSAFLMIFGMWISAFLFTVFYVVFFKKWIYNEKDAEKFEQLKQSLKSKGDDG